MDLLLFFCNVRSIELVLQILERIWDLLPFITTEFPTGDGITRLEEGVDRDIPVLSWLCKLIVSSKSDRSEKVRELTYIGEFWPFSRTTESVKLEWVLILTPIGLGFFLAPAFAVYGFEL